MFSPVNQLALDRLDLQPPRGTITQGPEPDLTAYDLIVVGLSGKDGHAALDVMATAAHRAGVFDRLLTIHADLGLMEWPGVHHRGRYYPSNDELVAQTSLHYGVPPERHIRTRRVVTTVDGSSRPQSLLEQVAYRRMFPDPARRWCTSDWKVSKIRAALTPIVVTLRPQLGRPVRILNVTGVRAEESNQRASRPIYNVAQSNQARHIDDYLPVHHLSTRDIHDIVDQSGSRHHWAYDSAPGADDWSGQTRLSCSQCIMGSKRDAILAARRRPRLAALYAEVEKRTGHLFRVTMSMAQIIEWASHKDGPAPGVILDEQNAEFDALIEAVRAQLDAPTKMRGSTEFTTTTATCPGCGAH